MKKITNMAGDFLNASTKIVAETKADIQFEINRIKEGLKTPEGKSAGICVAGIVGAFILIPGILGLATTECYGLFDFDDSLESGGYQIPFEPK